jgi:hypothetical protein
MKLTASKSVGSKGATYQSIIQHLSFDISDYPDTELMLFPDLQILKNTYKNLVGKPEGKRLFPRP